VIRACLLLLTSFALAACSSEPAREWPAPSPALWEVSGPEGQRGWLFGTVHALPDGVAWRTPALESALADSSVLVVEIADLTAGDGGLFDRLAHTSGQLPLTQRVEADERHALSALMKRAGKQDSDFSDTESWAAALILSSAIRSGDPANGVDRALIEAAGRVEGFESYSEQFAMFDTLSEEDQSDLLASVASDADEGGNGGTVEAWLTGDMEVLDNALSRGMLEYPALREVLVVRRNRVWAEQIDVMMANERPFVAVGAGHMVGAESLPALLAERGYTVTRIQ